MQQLSNTVDYLTRNIVSLSIIFYTKGYFLYFLLALSAAKEGKLSEVCLK